MSGASYLVGIDLGGTNIKAGVLDAEGRVRGSISIVTEAERGPDHVIDRIVEAIGLVTEEAAIDKDDILAVGVGSPGPLNHKKGIVVNAPNLPRFQNIAVTERVSRATGLNVSLENDANAAAWGEFWSGAGKDVDSMVLFTLGTGIGGGIICDGRLLRGAHDFAAELGHVIYQPRGFRCGCGQRGCLEAYSGAAHLGKQVVEAVRTGHESSLKKLVDEGRPVEGADVTAAVLEGDPLATHIWNECCEQFALACVNISHVVDPDLFVFGGGMSQAGGLLTDTIQKYIADLWWPLDTPPPKLALAKLGNDAGFIGAAGLAKEELAAGAA